jgi:hypothetical protein
MAYQRVENQEAAKAMTIPPIIVMPCGSVAVVFILKGEVWIYVGCSATNV